MKIEVPEDLGELSEDQLQALADEIRTAGEALAGDTSEEAVAELEKLVELMQRVTAELGERETAAEVRNERIAKARQILGTPDSPDETGDADDDEQATPEPVAASAEPSTTASTQPDTGPDDDPEDPQPEATQEAAVTTEPTSDAPSAPATTPGALVDALSARAPGAQTVVTFPSAGSAPTMERRELATFHNLGAVIEQDKGKKAGIGDIAGMIMEKQRQFRRLGTDGAMPPVYLARATTDFGDHERIVSGGDYETNFGVMNRVANQAQAIVAAGGNCAPLTPNYDVFNVAEPMSPVEAALPTVGAPRGGIRYVQPPVWTQAQAGVRFTTMAQDTAGYTGFGGTTPVKPCVHLECTSVVECEVDAISQCVTIGNLQNMTFREQVEVFLQNLAVAFAQAKEVYYLDAIEAGSTAVTFTPPYGASRGAVQAFALAAHAYRKRNHMPLDAPLDVLAPDSLVPLLKIDMVNDFSLGLNFLGANEVAVANELFRNLNLNVSWFYDFSTEYGSTGAMHGAQAAGALNDLPTMFRSYFYAPGTWIRLDGGELDLGIVRDSTLNSVNDFQIFAEEWTQVCKRGSESIQLDLTLCPSGVGPDPVTPLACAS